MKPGIFIAILACMIFATSFTTSHAQTSPALSPAPAKTLLERLGYPPDAKLLIVHADDLGMAHSINLASIKGLESGLVSSASIMIPCPWLPEIAAYARTHPEADLGLAPDAHQRVELFTAGVRSCQKNACLPFWTTTATST